MRWQTFPWRQCLEALGNPVQGRRRHGRGVQAAVEDVQQTVEGSRFGRIYFQGYAMFRRHRRRALVFGLMQLVACSEHGLRQYAEERQAEEKSFGDSQGWAEQGDHRR